MFKRRHQAVLHLSPQHVEHDVMRVRCRAFVTLGFLMLMAGTADAQGAINTMKDELTGQRFVWVNGGCFVRGADQAGGHDPYYGPMPPRLNETPSQRVCVKGFWMAQTPMTTWAWASVMSPTKLPPVEVRQHPQVKLSFEEVLHFAEKFQSAGGSWRLRLPSEAEWEWACRPQEKELPGFDDVFARSQATQAWAVFMDPKRANPSTEPVAQKRANAYGLYDMLGNVWEVTADEFDERAYARAQPGSTVPVQTRQRVALRGGSYRSEVTQVRCGARNWVHATERSGSVGVRWVAEAPPPVGVQP